MKKFALSLTVLILTLALGVGSAFAYTIDDTTDVNVGYSWDGTPTGYRYQDVVGNEGAFNTFGIDVSYESNGDITFDLYTNFSGPVTVGDLTVNLADLAIDPDKDGDYDYGIDLSAGSLYSNPTWLTSRNFIENTSAGNFLYGELWDTTGNNDGNDALAPVKMSGGTPGGGTFTPAVYADGRYSVSFSANLISGLEDGFNLFWGTATCSNDAIAGTVAPVPEPATMMLFGVGLIGMVGLGRKKLLKR